MWHTFGFKPLVFRDGTIVEGLKVRFEGGRAVDITAEAPEIRVAFTIRVVTAGNFELPGAQVEDMQRPSVYARQNGARLAIAPAD